MAHELDPKELVEFREMVLANTIQVDTISLVTLIIIRVGYIISPSIEETSLNKELLPIIGG